MEEIKNLIGNRIRNLFLIVWPPVGEEKFLDINMSIGIVVETEPDKMAVLSTDKRDMWTPYMEIIEVPQNTLPWISFYQRMEQWMKNDVEWELINEFYELREVDIFQNIINQEILSLEFISIVGLNNPFGVKLNFENEYILMTPISDGNTIETSIFNKNDNIENFNKLGIIEYHKYE